MPRQSSASGVPPGSPPGVSFPLAEAQIVSPTSFPAAGGCTVSNLGTQVAPIVLVNNNSTGFCLNSAVGGFTAGDTMFILEVTWNSSAVTSAKFQVQVAVDVSPAANDLVTQSWVQTTATITPMENAIYAVDLTKAGDTGVTGFNVLVTEP